MLFFFNVRRAWQPTPVFLPGECPWTEEPGRLQSRVLQRVGHNWVTKHNLFIYFSLHWVLLAAHGLSLVVVSKRYSLVLVCGLLFAVASFVVEHGLQGERASAVVVHRLRCPKTCGIFPDRGLNPCPQDQQVDSLPLDHQGSPRANFFV